MKDIIEQKINVISLNAIGKEGIITKNGHSQEGSYISTRSS